MNFRTARCFLLGAAGIAILAATSLGAADPLVEQSPFAQRTCLSYASPNVNGKPVEIPWSEFHPLDFGPRQVQYDLSGVRAVRQVPPPGVHPRILFTPDDLPDIRRRLKETRCGQAAWNNLLCWTEMMKGRYDDKAPYASNDVWKGNFGGLHGPVPLFRLGIPREKGFAYNHHPKAAEVYRSLVAGTAQEFPPFYWNVFALEAFRCLVAGDEAGAKDLAAAVVTAMKLDQAKRVVDRQAKKQSGPPDQPVGTFQLAFCYDFLHNNLTPQQRSAIHDELAESTWHHDNYGTFNKATASRSNWATFSYWLFETLAIEGEPGFNDLKVRGMYRGWRNLFTYGWFQSGATFEGEAKNQLGMDGVIPFALRQTMYGFENPCGHPYLRAYLTRFTPYSVIPTLDGFIKYDLLGGAHGRPMPPDLLGAKFMFPDDKVIDWVYRSAVGEHYENVPDRCDGYRNDLLFYLVYAMDFDPANNHPAKLGLGNTFFCGERALMMTRSGWDKDALLLNLHTRQANGGHPFADRNSIVLAGAGRVWSPPGYASFQTPENSLVCIDNQTQDLAVPGRIVDFVDRPQATFAVGDAAYCWNWKYRFVPEPKGPWTIEDAKLERVVIPPGWEPEVHSVNDFAYTKLPWSYLNDPIFQAPHWLLKDGYARPTVRQANFPVQKAFRTAGLVRGEYPYALVVDDIRKDDAVHHYDWIFTLEKDIKIVKSEPHGAELDVLLQGDDSPARLLVRVLHRNTTAGREDAPRVEDLNNAADPKKYGPIRRLVIPTDAVAPDFKILLYPHHTGDPLPTTTASDDHAAVTVAWPRQTDQIRFTPGALGKTDLTIARQEGATSVPIVSVNKPIEPLRDALLEKRAAEETRQRAEAERDLVGFDPLRLTGAVAYWGFEKEGLADCLDRSRRLSGSGLKPTPGRHGRGLQCAGDKAGIVLPLDLQALGKGGLTVTLWARDPEKKNGTLLANNAHKAITLGLENGAVRIDTQGQYRHGGNVPIDATVWHHLAVTMSSQGVSIYLDGKLLRSLEGHPVQFSTTTHIGENFHGVLDDLRVYRRALTAAEVHKIYAYEVYLLERAR
jgi:hypothetical protein